MANVAEGSFFKKKKKNKINNTKIKITKNENSPVIVINIMNYIKQFIDKNGL